MSQVRLLWIGCLESEQEFEKKSKKGYKLASAQVSQYNILTGLEEVTGLSFDSINGSVLPPYPIYKDLDVSEVNWSRGEDNFNISVGYKNRKFINRILCQNEMIKATRRWVKERYKGEDLIVFVYSMRSSAMAAGCEIKKLIPNAKIYLIITDLPQYMDLGQGKVKSLLKKIDFVQIKKMQKKYDGFILYAEKMAEYLNISNSKWTLMEGLYDSKELNSNQANLKKKSIMYSGSLDLKYGIEMLLNAFMEIDDNTLELWLTGGGNAETYIKQCALKDNRIKFFGFLPSREEVLEKQKEASLLINMRLPSEAASSYCFPSKLFEYMATGTPVLSFKLDGIPQTYHQYLVIVKEESAKSLAKTIKSCFDDSLTLQTKALQAKEFILKEKNKKAQCEHIWSFVNKNEG